jgi:uncharacterized protein YjaZ
MQAIMICVEVLSQKSFEENLKKSTEIRKAGKKLRNEELHNLCFPLNIKKRRIKENGMGGAYSARKK